LSEIIRNFFWVWDILIVVELFEAADDWANEEEEEDEESEEDEEASMKVAQKPKPPVEQLKKKNHMNIIFIGHVGKLLIVLSCRYLFRG